MDIGIWMLTMENQILGINRCTINVNNKKQKMWMKTNNKNNGKNAHTKTTQCNANTFFSDCKAIFFVYWV